MKIHTAEHLIDFLAQETVWRKKEMTAFKWLLESNRDNKDRQQALLRSGVALLYAHWEGFVKAAATAYLEYVARQQLAYADLKANFMALGMKAHLEQARESKKPSVFIRVAELFLSGLSDKCEIHYKTAVNTRANLSSLVFKEIVCLLDIEVKSLGSCKMIGVAVQAACAVSLDFAEVPDGATGTALPRRLRYS